MKKVFTLAFALFICSAAFAQFTNAKSGSRGGNSGGAGFGEMSYKGFVEAGYAIGLGDDKDKKGEKPEMNRFDISTSHGVQFGGHFFAGLGTGFKWFTKEFETRDGKKEKENFFNIPVFADIRANLFEDNSINPYIGLKIGYAIGIKNKDMNTKIGGFICTPAIGCRFGINEKTGLAVSVGYDIQKGKYEPDRGDDTKLNVNGLVFKVGIDF